MLNNYIKIAWRNLWRNKIFSIVNILGLTLSMVCSMLIFLWILDEATFDSFLTNSERVVRLVQTQEFNNGELFKVAATPAPMAPFFKEKFPEIAKFARIRPLQSKSLLGYNDIKLYEEVTYVDSTFFELFDFPFIVGSSENALKDPNSIILTERMAEKFFGKVWQNEEVLGRILILNNNEQCKVTGVIENIPSNSHLSFDVLLPFQKLYQYGWNLDWGNNYYYAYFLLEKDADHLALSTKISDFAKTREDFADILYVQPIEEIHLYSDLDIDLYGSTELRYPYIRIFSIVALVIILIACINFMNLSTARSEKRAKEIGLRKTIGARRSGIINQLLSESVLFALISLLVALTIVQLVLPYFNSIVEKSLSLGVEKWRLIFLFFCGTVLIGILAGIYPALYLSGFQPIKVLKGTFKGGKRGLNFRRSLVVVQFTITVVLVFGTLVIYKQFQYFMDKDLGYDKELLIYLPIRGNINENYNIFKDKLMENHHIKGVTASSDLPTYTVHSAGGFDWEGRNPDDVTIFHHFSVGFDYFETLGLTMAEGRSFSPDFLSDSTNYILNEAAVKLTGLDSPVGQRFNMWGNEGKIVGVVKDFNFKSLHHKVEPLVLRIDASWDRYYFIKISSENIDLGLGLIEEAWNQVNPDYPFEYHFLDEQYENLYKSEKRMAEIFNYFTLFTLFVACLGLFGLMAFMAEKRQKEISIRKVLGASIANILILLSKEYIRLILIAFVVSIPAAIYLLKNWLSNFAFRIELSWWYYIIPVLLVLFISLITVSGQTIKAAIKNPVDSLKNE